MTTPPRSTATDLLSRWRARVRADRKQVERAREIDDAADFYAPVAGRFRLDPRRRDDPTVNALIALARAGDVWLDVGSGAGRYALPLALAVRRVIAIDPSPAMIGALRADMAEHDIHNIHLIPSRWPMRDPPAGDVALMAHVGYDIADIGPFLDAFEAAARRLCVAVLAESAMTTVASLFWTDVHGEARVRLPALFDLLELLAARGREPEVEYVPRDPPTFASAEEALEVARRQLWVKPGSRKDIRLRGLLHGALTESDGRYAFEWTPTRIGIATWSPGS